MDIKDSLLSAIQTMIDSGLNQVSFDRTEICTIVSKVENEEYKYWVSNGAIKYQANAEVDTEYNVNSQVYVTIPQGNYELEKIIIGQYVSNEDSKILYVNPFDKIVKLHSFSGHYTEKAYEDVASVGLNLFSSPVKSTAEQEPLPFYTNGLGDPHYLALRFNMNTGANVTQPKGNFYINIDFLDAAGNSLITPPSISDEEEIAKRKALLTYSSSQMTGNPYELSKTIWHEHLFSFPLLLGNTVVLKDLTKVKKVVYTLYKDSNSDFTILNLPELEFFAAYDVDKLNEEKVVLNTTFGETYSTAVKPKLRVNWRHLKDNVIRNKIYPIESTDIQYHVYWFKYVDSYTDPITFQSFVEGLDTETVQVFYQTTSPQDDKWTSEIDKLNHVGSLWIDRNNKKTFIYNDEYKWEEVQLIPDQMYTIITENTDQAKAYTTKPSSQSIGDILVPNVDFSSSDQIFIKDEVYVSKSNTASFSPTNWEKISFIKGLTINQKRKRGVYWKTVQGPIDAIENEAYEYSPTLNTKLKKEQFKVAITGLNDFYIESQGLTFENLKFKEETKLSDTEIDNLILVLDEGDDGVYNDYGIDGMLFNTSSLYQTHNISVKFADNTRWYQNKVSEITWKIPKYSSMLYLPYLQTSSGSWGYGGDLWEDENFDANYYICKQDVTKLSFAENDGQDTILPTIQFGVREKFDYTRTHNTIYCSLTLTSGEKYQGKLKLDFGLRGTSGTEYNFNIRPLNNIRSLNDVDNNNQTSTMELQTYLEKNDGTPVSGDLWKNKVVWSWYSCTKRQNGTKMEPIYSLSSSNDQAIITREYIEGKENIDYYAIVKASVKMTVSNGNEIKLEAYYPIPSGASKFYLEGATRIIYNTNGNTPIYDDNTPYKLLEQINNKYTEYSKAKTYQVTTNETAKSEKRSFLLDSEKNTLLATNILSSKIPQAYVSVIDDDNDIIYAHPLLILRNNYQAQLLNQWDGQLNVDEENNQIFAATMVAGEKDSNNRFTGMVLGAVGAKQDESNAKYGLYGYQEGNKRYELTEDGTFYVGTGDDNKIEFNDEGKLDISTKQFDLETISDTKIPTMTIRSKTNGEDDPLRYVGENGLKDWKIWLGDGISTKEVDGDGNSATTDDKKYYPKGSFGVTKDGIMHASGAVIHGEITFTNKDAVKGALGIDKIEEQIDGQINTYYQDTDPSSEWKEEDYLYHLGDLWKYTGADKEIVNKVERRKNSEWVWAQNGQNYEWKEDKVSNAVFDAIDGKSVIYTDYTVIVTQNPGDLYIPTSNQTWEGKEFEKGKVYKSTATTLNTPASPDNWEEMDLAYIDDASFEGFVKNTYGPALAAIATQDDEIGETWYQSDDPASNWTTDELKAEHVGDLWYNTNTKKSSLYTSLYEWTELEGVMQDFYDKTDKKATIYISQPSTWQKNDLLIPTAQFTWGSGAGAKTFYKDKVYKSNGNVSEAQNDWIEIAYTDNAEFEKWKTETYGPTLVAINSSIDKKAETWYQSTDPSTSWTTAELKASHVGDLWKYTGTSNIELNTNITVGGKSKKVTAKPYSEWMWTNALDGTVTKFFWQEMMVPDEVYDKIDGKKTIYVAQPTEQAIGDLLIPTNTFTWSGTSKQFKAGKVYKSTSKTLSANNWTEIAYTDDTVADQAKTAATTVNSKVNKALGITGTEVADNYIISPAIGGGYLNISNSDGTKQVIIDPANTGGTGKIFQVKSNGNVVIGFDTSGNATFNGVITAKEGGNIGGWVIGENSMKYYSGSTLRAFLSGTGTQNGSYTVGNHTGSDWSIWVNGNFGVTNDGTLYTKAGKIAGWTMGSIGTAEILYAYHSDGTGSGLYMDTGGQNPAFYVGYTKQYDWYDYPSGYTGWGNNGKDGVQYGPQDGSWFSYGSVKGEIDNNGNFYFGSAKNNQYISFNGSVLTVKGDITATNLNLTGTATVPMAKVTGNLSASRISSGTLSNEISIAGWTINNNTFYIGTTAPSYREDTTKYSIILSNRRFYNANCCGGGNSGYWLFTVGTHFGVESDGEFFASKANILNGSTIANWTINNSYLYSPIAQHDWAPDGYYAQVRLGTNTLGYAVALGTTMNSFVSTYWSWVVDKTDHDNTSDIRLKKDVERYDDKYELFFNLLNPIRYKYINGTSGRYHTGFIAQEVVGALEESGLTTQDFAAVMLRNPGKEDERWQLRRDEFVSLNTWQIQKLKARVTELEKEIKELKQNYEI